jgi:hypothetical protein
MANISKYPTAASQTGTGFFDSLSNILLNDDANTYITFTGTGLSPQVTCSDFNFDIPLLSTVEGIIVSIDRNASANSRIRDDSIYLAGSFYNTISEDKSTGSYWSSNQGVNSFGSPSDTWNADSAVTGSNINSLSVSFRCENTYEFTSPYTTVTAYIDYVQVTVYYTVKGLKYSTTSINNVFYGNTEIKKIYYGTTQIK